MLSRRIMHHRLRIGHRLLQRACSTAPSKYRVSPAVRAALQNQQPVVALESTIITHGMPYPDNVTTAQEVQKCVVEHGAVPATIAVLDGVIHVGLDDAAIADLGQMPRGSVRKASRRDLALCMAQGATASTTVASTMLIAHMCGIHVFATGGIGGVHRGGEVSMDISADLIELSRTPVAVVCAGVKSILDIPRTLEYLETHGVPVITLGGAGANFPAFFSASSGVPSPLTAASVEVVASAMHESLNLGLKNGLLVAVPNPKPMDGDAIEAVVQQALRECTASSTSGRDVTPFVLERVHKLTGGASITANVELIKNNARTAAKMAVALARLRTSSSTGRPWTSTARGMCTTARQSTRTGPPIVLGGACVDIISKPATGSKLIGSTSNPGVVTHTFGGVGRNVCEALARVRRGVAPVLVTALGFDTHAESIQRYCAGVGVQVLTPVHAAGRTGVYNAMLDETGEMVAAVADMDVFEVISPQVLESPLTTPRGFQVAFADVMATSPLLICDGNVPEAGLSHAVQVARRCGTPVLFECTSVPKCGRILPALHAVAIVKANVHEVKALAKGCRRGMGLQVDLADEPEHAQPVQRASGDEDAGEVGELDYSLCTAAATVLAGMTRPEGAGGIPQAVHAHAEAYIRALREGSPTPELPSNAYTARRSDAGATLRDGRKYVIVTMGADGVLIVSARGDASLYGGDMMAVLPFFAAAFHAETGMDYLHIPAPPAEVVKVTGAGDTFAGVLAARLCDGMTMTEAARHALAGAYLAVTTPAGSGASTISAALSAHEVARVAKERVKQVEEEE